MDSLSQKRTTLVFSGINGWTPVQQPFRIHKTEHTSSFFLQLFFFSPNFHQLVISFFRPPRHTHPFPRRTAYTHAKNEAKT